MSKVWLITGTSSGFGREIVLSALKRGDKVIATARDPKKITDLKDLGAATLALDVTSPIDELNRVAQEAISIYGQVDILVNNAAYLIEGGIEETSPEETFTLFNTNVFGLLNVTRAFLPHFRSRRAGVIANLSSIGGWTSSSGVSLYCTTKFAIEGITEGLRAETAHLGITVTVIEPGYFRTNFLQAGHRQFTATRIADYEESVGKAREMLNNYNLKQPGDPIKGAQRIVDILTQSGTAAGRSIPVRVPLGSDAFQSIQRKCVETQALLEEWKPIILSTDHDDTK